MNLRILKKVLSVILILVFFFNGVIVCSDKATASSTIPVFSNFTHHTTYQWCQHGDGHWTGGTAMFGIKTRNNAGGQPAYKDEIIKILTNLSVPTYGWEDADGNSYAYSSLSAQAKPSSGDFTHISVKNSVSGSVIVSNGSVFVQAKIGNGVSVDHTKAWTGNEPNSICGNNPGFEYLIDINVKWVSTVIVPSTDKFVSLEIDPTYKTLSVGQSQQFTVFANWTVNGVAKRYPVTNDKLSWSSSLPSNAPVSSSGNVRGVKKTTGDAKITAKFTDSGGANGATASASVKVIESTTSTNSPTADFEILPGTTISYGDSFTFQPTVTIPSSCTFKSLKYKMTRGSLSYETNAITSSTSNTTFTKSDYPPLIQAGQSHSITMTAETSCGSAEAEPKTLFVQEGGSPVTPPPEDPANNPPHVDIGWYDSATGDRLSTVPIGTIANLRATNMTDPDGDAVSLVAWDFTRSSEWLAELPVKRPITGLAPGYDGITLDGQGLHTVYLTVADSRGAEYTAEATVGVIDPTPVAVIKGSTRVKEGRTLALLLNGNQSYSPIGNKIVKYDWTNKADSYPKAGMEVVRLKVTDEDGRVSDVATHTIDVIPDDPPVASLIVPAEGTRLDVVRIQSASYSADGDTIVSHKIEMKYDANNNGFADEAWAKVQEGKTDFYTFTPNKVGKYLFRETVCEDFGKCSNTDGQPESERTLDVKNLAPEVSVDTSSAITEPDNKNPISLSDMYSKGSFYSLDTRSATNNNSWKYEDGAIKSKEFMDFEWQDSTSYLATGDGTLSVAGYSNYHFDKTVMYNNFGFGSYYSSNQIPYDSFNTSPVSFRSISGMEGGNVIVDDNSVYIFNNQMPPSGGQWLTVYAYDKKTFALKWTKLFNGAEYLNSNIVSIGDRLYFMTAHEFYFGTGAYLYIVNKEDGSIFHSEVIGSPGYQGGGVLGAWPNGLFVGGMPNSLIIDLDGNVKDDIFYQLNYYGYSPFNNSVLFGNMNLIYYTSNYDDKYFSAYETSGYTPKYSALTYNDGISRVVDIKENGTMDFLTGTRGFNGFNLQTLKIKHINLTTGAVTSQSNVAIPPFVENRGGWYPFATELNGDIHYLGSDNKGNFYLSTNNGATYVNIYKSYGQLIKSFNPFATDSNPNFTPAGTYPRTKKMFVGADGKITFYGNSYNPSEHASYNFFFTIDPDTFEVTNSWFDTRLTNPYNVIPFDDHTFLMQYIDEDSYNGYIGGYYGPTPPMSYELISTSGPSTGVKYLSLGRPTNDLIMGDSFEEGTTLESSVRFSSSKNQNGSGIVFAGQNSSNYYSVEFDSGKLKVNKLENGVSSTLFTKSYPITENTNYNVKVAPNSGEGFDIYINRLLQTTISNPKWSKGKFGFINRGRYGVQFSNSSYAEAGDNESRIAGVVLVGQTLDYTVNFEDAEGDRRMVEGEKWTYSHSPNVFLNSTGNWGKDGVSFSKPITSFDHPGDYHFSFKSKDDPNSSYLYPSSAFDSYRQDSNEVVGKIRVHRRPVAIFTATLKSGNTLSYTDSSYDPDRYNPSTGQYSTEATGINYASNHGVIDRRWRYRLAQATSYVEGKPTKLPAVGAYVIELSVRDEYGAWSEWASQTVNVTSGISPKPPVAGFTVSSPTTYHNARLTINSTATDPQDGARENLTHAYYIKNASDGVETMQSNSRTRWDKLFTSLGIFNIRQVITNSYGLSAEVSHSVQVLNRKPTVAVVTPASAVSSSPTIFDTLRPQFGWTYADADHDLETKYQVQIYKTSGALVLDSSARTGSVVKWTASSDLPEGPVMYAIIRAYDGYDWGAWSPPKYFRIETNKPPTGDFTWSPTLLYEGDAVNFHSAVADPDGDPLDLTYVIESPTGTKQTFHYTWNAPYKTTGPSLSAGTPGVWTATLTVSDRKAPAVTVTHTFRVWPLTISGQVRHTDAWEANRIRYNEKHPDAPRPADWFWAGEAFVLEALVTDTGASTTKPVEVTADAGEGLRKALAAANAPLSRWNGKLGSQDAGKELSDLPEGDYTFIFQVKYSNGVVKTAQATIRIQGIVDEYVQVHRVQ